MSNFLRHYFLNFPCSSRIIQILKHNFPSPGGSIKKILFSIVWRERRLKSASSEAWQLGLIDLLWFITRPTPVSGGPLVIRFQSQEMTQSLQISQGFQCNAISYDQTLNVLKMFLESTILIKLFWPYRPLFSLRIALCCASQAKGRDSTSNFRRH